MLDYRLYFLNEGGHIVGAIELDCANDADAIMTALAHADGRAMELWRRDRWIRRFAAGERQPGVNPRELRR